MEQVEFIVIVEVSILSRISMVHAVRESGLVVGKVEKTTITNILLDTSDDESVWGEVYLMHCKGSKTKYEQFKISVGLKEVPGLDDKLLWAVEVEEEA